MLQAFFLIIGGIQPKLRILDEKPVRCPSCGLPQAHLQRIDHYLSIFFIPLIRVKTGEPVLVCDRCRQTASASGSPEPAESRPRRCRLCKRNLPADYLFCPKCGLRL